MKKVAYFSMEIGIDDKMPTYSGGLGVLAGDTLKSAADLSLPIVGVSLLHRKGYFRQTIDDDKQRMNPEHWNPSDHMELLSESVKVEVEGEEKEIRAWKYECEGVSGNKIPVLFLETFGIEPFLYPDSHYEKIKQETVLGIGGVRLLQKLGFDVETYHMNEGHSAFLTLELLRQRGWKDDDVRRSCVFTTHTPVSAGHDFFDYSLIEGIVPDLPWHLRDLAGQHGCNMTKLALSLSKYVNAVSQKHAFVCNNNMPDFFGGYNVEGITNGVHHLTWTSDSFKELFDDALLEWRENPELLAKLSLDHDGLWQAHKENKSRLCDLVDFSTGKKFDEDILTIGFARRFATYKRADLPFTNLERLIDICEGKVQFVYAGKAHPADKPGQNLLGKIIRKSKRLGDKVKVAFIENYNMAKGKFLTSGVDLWLNNPQKPMEASGTSGMKTTFNGGPNFSGVDGWWCEGHKEGVTGWSIDGDHNHQEASSLYHKLENIIIPMFYDSPGEWRKIMHNVVTKNAFFFNTHRMVKDYAKRVYGLRLD